MFSKMRKRKLPEGGGAAFKTYAVGLFEVIIAHFCPDSIQIPGINCAFVFKLAQKCGILINRKTGGAKMALLHGKTRTKDLME